MRLLYSVTLILAAFLLFLMQPMVAKAVLPRLGGSPSVWNTCMVFFQAALLGGYTYVHLSKRALGTRQQSRAHVIILAMPALAYFLGLGAILDTAVPPGESDPTAWLLVWLLVSVGPLFFAIATTAPLLQAWYGSTSLSSARDPFFLYAASNAGSLLGLFAYPFWIEPRFSLVDQVRGLTGGYAVLCLFILGCAGRVPIDSARVEDAEAVNRGRPVGVWRRLRWVGLAFVPSSLMLGVTTYLSTDIAAVPLLWVVPLGLYLLSFILAFARRRWVSTSVVARLLPGLVILLVPALAAGLVWKVWLPIHLMTFFVAGLLCHGQLADDRPGVSGLTEFYLSIAVGGVCGGAFNALLAPVVFDRPVEYPLAVVLACLALPGVGRVFEDRRQLAREMVIPGLLFLLVAGLVSEGSTWSQGFGGSVAATAAAGLFCLAVWRSRSRPLCFAASVGAVWLACGLAPGVDDRVLLRERNFFGVLRVTESGSFRRLFHGTTLHGQQSLDPRRRSEPLSYFGREGPVGQILEAPPTDDARRRVAVIGLGVGTLAAYARPGEAWDFYEIDPAIARVASDPSLFSYLADAPSGCIRLVLGDARIRLSQATQSTRYDVIVIDAFGSDAPPVHLLTREALGVYRSRLREGGLILVNLTNRYLDLEPVLGGLARDAGMACRVRRDIAADAERRRARAQLGLLESIWGVLADRDSDLGTMAEDPRWREFTDADARSLWTDDHSDLLSHLRLAFR